MLLKISEEIRQQVEARMANAKKTIDKILESESLEEAIARNIGEIDQVFVDALARELQEAEKAKDKQRAEKINQILQILQRLSSPPELEVVEELLEAADNPADLEKAIENIDEELLPRVIEYLTSIVSNYEEQLKSGTEEGNEELESALEDLKSVFNGVLKKSMENKFKS
jgi:hypothetical protein